MRKVATGLTMVLLCVCMVATTTGALTKSSGRMKTPPAPAHRSLRPNHLSTLHRGLGTSTNWAGWLNTGSTFTDARASWTQPAASCPTAAPKYSSFWVGLDGYNSNSVEQIGTDSDCFGTNHPVYYGWFEMFPAAPVTLSRQTYPIGPGDAMSAVVSVTGTQFNFELVNWTRRWVYKATRYSSTARRSSAEWIVEAPSGCNVYGCEVLPLADFGSMSFSHASTVGNGRLAVISTFRNDALVMVNSTRTVIKSVPSELNSSGSGFSLSWKHS